MADHIPFITGDEVCSLAGQVYADSAFARVLLDRAQRQCPRLPKTMKVWLDPGIDGMDDLKSRRSEWLEFMGGFPNFAKVSNPANHAKPIAKEVYTFVKAVMDRCAAQKSVEWITVPQLPLVDAAERNRINRELAAATGRWRTDASFSGRLILPMVITNQKQANRKTERNLKVEQAHRCYGMAQADGFWIVESSLRDDDGSSTLGRRLRSVIALHDEMNEAISSKIRIGGPYWGLNLVLWARGLIDYPAIGIGSGYQFMMAGGYAKQPSARLALRSLRRRASAGTQLVAWLDDAIRRLAPSHPARGEFVDLRKRYPALLDPNAAREQVARVYKEWFDVIGAAPKVGRSVALFQDLATAFALGKSLPDLAETGPARKPAAVAEPLMLNCL